MTRKRLKIRNFIETKRPQLIDSSGEDGFDDIYICLNDC